MAINWTSLQATIYKIYKKNGFLTTIRTPGAPGEYDDTIEDYWGATADSDETTYALKDEYKISQIDGDLVRQNDSKLVFPAYGISHVSTTQKILIEGVEQNVISINVVDPGNVPLIYEAQIRG